MQFCPYDGRPLHRSHEHFGVLVIPQPDNWREPPRIPPAVRLSPEPPIRPNPIDARHPVFLEKFIAYFARRFPEYVVIGGPMT
jgi:hypothetical protein